MDDIVFFEVVADNISIPNIGIAYYLERHRIGSPS